MPCRSELTDVSTMWYGRNPRKQRIKNHCDNTQEEPLPANGACLLGSLNLAAFVSTDKNGKPYFETSTFAYAVDVAVRALDTVQQQGIVKHPLQKQRECADDWRQIGLGVMGIADMLIKLGVTYGSTESLRICDMIGDLLAKTAIRASNDIAKENERYIMWDDRVMDSAYFKRHVTEKGSLDDIKTFGLANSQLLTIAPTGTLSTMLGISGGIEPIFANFYNRTTKTLHGHDQTYKVYTPIVASYMAEHNLTDESQLPEYFVTSADIPIENRIAMQATWQKHIDASISSTINLPNSATVEDVERLYIGAWQAGLKGVTVYRAGCAREGILTTDDTPKQEAPAKLPMKKNMGLERHLTTGCGSLHVCAFFDENGRLKNTYLSKGSSGGCNNFMIGLSRMISLAARNGVGIKEIVDQLNSCGTCPSYAVRRATKHDTSTGSCCPVAVGNALMDMWHEVNGEQDPSDEPDHIPHDKCPECGGELIHEMGCVTCTSCGYSKCG